MAKKAAPCKCKKSECEECPEWIFTFADLVMLMMGFFVILWVLKPAPNPKGSDASNDDWVKMAAAIRDAFGYVPKAGSSDPVDVQMIMAQMRKLKVPDGPGMGGKTVFRPDGVTGTDPMVTSIRTGPQSLVGGKLIFEKASPELSVALTNVLDQVVDQIRGYRNIVLIKGHTSLDDFNDTATAQQKMELSSQRAQFVADYFIAHGVSPDVLRVEGCSTFEPVVQREYTPDVQTQNRRVEVEVTPTLVSTMQSDGDRSAATTKPIAPATQP